MYQVHISEARVGAALDKLAYMEKLVNERLLDDRRSDQFNSEAQSPSISSSSIETSQNKLPRRGLNVSGPVKSYHPNLKNFWYPVAFSCDLKDDTMVIKPLFYIKRDNLGSGSASVLCIMT